MADRRSRLAVLLLKIETTEGVDAAPDATDAILIEIPSRGIQIGAQVVDTSEVRATLDASDPIVAGTPLTLQATVNIRGAALPGDLPNWHPITEIAGFDAVRTRTDLTADTISFAAAGGHILDSGSGLAALTAGTLLNLSGAAHAANRGDFLVATSAAGDLTVTRPDGSAAGLADEPAGAGITLRHGVAGTAATAGTTTSATLQAPFGTTAQQYRGMPVVLSGNPAVPALACVTDYGTGRVASLTDLLGSALSAATKVSIPANTLYVPTSDPARIRTATAYLHLDGVVYKMLSVRANIEAMFPATTETKPTQLAVTLQGLYGGHADAASPAVSFGARPTPLNRGGRFLIDRVRAAIRECSLRANNTLSYPPDTNEAEGMRGPILTARRWEGTANPQAGLMATRDTFARLRANATAMIHWRYADAPLGTGLAGTPGSRIAVTVPAAHYTGHDITDNQGILRDGDSFRCTGADAAVLQFCIF